MNPVARPSPFAGPPAGPYAGLRPPGRARRILAALGISVLFILAYYMAQLFAQLLYAVILGVAAVLRSVTDGIPAGNFRIDIWAILEQVEAQYTVVAAIYAAILAVSYGVFIRSRGRLLPGYVRMDRPRRSHWPAAAAAAFGMLGTANLLYEGFAWLAGRSGTVGEMLSDYEELVDDAFTTDAGVGWLILGICILVPIAEELLFRGIVQGELSAVMSPWAAVLTQAALFSAFHMQPVQSVYVFLPGLVMGLAYMASGSILVPILMHMVFNFFGSGALYQLTGGSDAVDAALYASQYGFILVGALCLAWMFRTRAKPPLTDGDGGAGQDGIEDTEEPA